MSGVVRLVLWGCLLATLWPDSLAVRQVKRLRLLGNGEGGEEVSDATIAGVKHIPTLSTEQLESRLRSRRAVSDNLPYVYGNHSFPDGNPKARIHYSGSKSPVSMIHIDRYMCKCE